MIIELGKINFKTEAEKLLKVYYDKQIVGEFYVDLFIEDEIIARPPRLSQPACQAERGSQGSRWRAGGTQIGEKHCKRTRGTTGQLLERLKKRDRFVDKL